jgi:hypothetical protein
MMPGISQCEPWNADASGCLVYLREQGISWFCITPINQPQGMDFPFPVPILKNPSYWLVTVLKRTVSNKSKLLVYSVTKLASRLKVRGLVLYRYTFIHLYKRTRGGRAISFPTSDGHSTLLFTDRRFIEIIPNTKNLFFGRGHLFVDEAGGWRKISLYFSGLVLYGHQYGSTLPILIHSVTWAGLVKLSTCRWCEPTGSCMGPQHGLVVWLD